MTEDPMGLLFFIIKTSFQKYFQLFSIFHNPNPHFFSPLVLMGSVKNYPFFIVKT